MRFGETPGKFSRKKVETASSGLGAEERALNVESGAKRVQVKDLSVLGIAMNILSELGQMCRWLGEVRKPSVAEALGVLF
jgi:hypothetical protein